METLWTQATGRLSWQVLNEFYANAARKLRTPAAEARQVVSVFSKWRPSGVSMEQIERAWYWMDKAQLAYWDAMILASAERQGCSFLLSEDFQAGRSYGMVRVVDPFATQPPKFAA